MPSHRLITIPGYFVLWLAWLAAAPIWFPLALIVDLVRRRNFVALRSASFLVAYLSLEVVGMLTCGVLSIRRALFGIDPARWTDIHFGLEAWWGTRLFRAVVWNFGLSIEVEGEAEADLARGPYILALRHSSLGDTLIAATLVSDPYALRLRYILKKETAWDPCLDIVGHRVPNVFVDRSGTNSAREIASIRELAQGLGPTDGVLIYPEGTRFSTAKQARVLDRLSQGTDTRLLEYARSLEYVLPPRLGGMLGLLDGAPEADVVVCSHTGFESAGSPSEIWRGDLINQVIRVRFKRVPRSQIPTDREARTDWLHTEWQQIDAWIKTQRQSA